MFFVDSVNLYKTFHIKRTYNSALNFATFNDLQEFDSAQLLMNRIKNTLRISLPRFIYDSLHIILFGILFRFIYRPLKLGYFSAVLRSTSLQLLEIYFQQK